MSLDRDGTALAAFIAGTMLAGVNAVGVRVSNRELDPLWGAFSARTPGDDERSGDGDGRLWSASRAVYTFVLIPLVTVLLSVWIDDEPIGAGLVLGGLLVLAGVYVGALRPAASPALQTQVERNAPE